MDVDTQDYLKEVSNSGKRCDIQPASTPRETGRAARRTERCEQDTVSSTPTKLVVAAIDFGTTYSGYAYSFLSDFKKDNLNIYANKTWNTGGEESLVTEKTPTTILFKPDETFHSFGYEAETKYAELAEDDIHKDWYYFSNFKMSLHGQTIIKREMKLTDDQGHEMLALEVFSESIKYLKNHLLTRLEETKTDIENTDIHWVITVPAIWDDGAKQFMRDAGGKAGIPNNRLDLAFEPEAAAIYCKTISVKKDGSLFEPGTQFILADLGGGTADITIHEVQQSGNLTELSPPSGGPWGGTNVDAAFNTLLENIFGEPVIHSFHRNSKDDELDLKREFELKKRHFAGGDKVSFKNLRVLTKTLKKNGHTLETILSDTIYESKVMQKRDKVYITGSVMSELFEDVIENIIKHMMELLTQRSGVDMILMVGGFSESEIIKKAVRDAFPRKKVIIPDDASLAVLKGAVMYGHDKSVIISRSMPFTYGVGMAVPFDESKHPTSKKYYIYDGYKCLDNFKVFIQAGETVIPGETTIQHILNTSVKVNDLEIYKTKSKCPIYVDEPGCSSVGKIQLKLNEIGVRELRHIQITMSFGSTELSVQAKEEGTNNVVDAKFNCIH